MCRILGSLLLGVIQFPVTSAKRISVYQRQHYWHSAQHAILSQSGNAVACRHVL